MKFHTKQAVPAILGLGLLFSPSTRGSVIGHWLFNEGSGSIALDSSGQGNHGTIFGGASYVASPGTYGISLDGIDDFTAAEMLAATATASALSVRLDRHIGELWPAPPVGGSCSSAGPGAADACRKPGQILVGDRVRVTKLFLCGLCFDVIATGSECRGGIVQPTARVLHGGEPVDLLQRTLEVIAAAT